MSKKPPIFSRLFGWLFSPASQFLPEREVFSSYDKLCFALGRGNVDLFRVTIKGRPVWFCLAKLKDPKRIWMSGEKRGKTQQLTFLNYYGPCVGGAFQGLTSVVPHAIVREFLHHHLSYIPKHEWVIVDREPSADFGPLWKEINGCFADALVHAKTNHHTALFAHGDDGAHAASVLFWPFGASIFDVSRQTPDKARTKLTRWDLIAQEVLPRTPVRHAFLLTL